MIIAPLRANRPRGPKSIGRSTPAPTGGWNKRDNFADMDELDAVVLDNWFPEQSRVRLRRGHASHATGMSGSIESLMGYSSPSANKMFAANGTNIYDVSSSGAVGAASVSSLNNARWQHAMFGTSGGSFLYLVNGEDDPRYYDGSTWTTPTITGSGLTPANLIHVNVFKRRLFFIENNTLSFWYFPVTTISGAISEFDLGSVCRKGGYLMAMGTWTRDAGDGVNDLAVFVTSNGEVIIYAGTDPGDAAAWSHVGTFEIGAPIGRRCLFKVGADLILITQDGFVPLSTALQNARVSDKAALSDKIVGAVTEATRSYGGNFGWQPILYPKGNMLLFNVPTQENDTAVQFVANSTTRAWCRFTGMDANCWEVFNDNLYFGGNDGAVYLADSGTSDNGANITADAKPAFNYFGARGRLKRFTNVRPVLASNGDLTLGLALNVDFEDRIPLSTPTFSGSGGSPWDTSDWDTSDWGITETVLKDWQGVEGTGYCASLRMRVATNALEVYWHATDWLMEPGGYL